MSPHREWGNGLATATMTTPARGSSRGTAAAAAGVAAGWRKGDDVSGHAYELRRHAPVGRPRRRGVARSRGLPHLYATPKQRLLPDLYLTDRAEARRGGGFRWFFSTCLAATVGAVAIAAVIFGSMDANEGRRFPPFQWPKQHEPVARRQPAPEPGLAWAVPKADRLQTTTGAMATKYVVQETMEVRRENRPYIQKRPYARIVVRLAAVPANETAQIPRFDPVRLLAGGPKGDGADEKDGPRPVGGDVNLRVVELAGSILPTEDGQELDSQEVADLVRRTTSAAVEEQAIRPTFQPEGADRAADPPTRQRQARVAPEPLAPNTSVVEKTMVDTDEVADDTEAEGRRIKVRLHRGERLDGLLRRHGADTWLARSMVEAVRTAQLDAVLTPELEIEIGLLASLTTPGKLEPGRVTATTEAGEHRLTVMRNAAGEFVASATPMDTAPKGNAGEQATTLYASLWHAALAQGIPPETIEQILRVHAPETDFRRRARGSDSAELFFDLKDEDKGADSAPGDLLFSSMTVAGEPRRYWRFRTPDGLVDFYDANGANSRRFLMKKPLRGDDIKETSGYGMRWHPLLKDRRMHTGIDFAGPMNTPILSAGSGVIEEARYKGQNGNYVRIRHANGYQTAYSHLNRIAASAREGTRVTQGQVIGYLGNTGLSTGPHLHFEVLIGNRFVDPGKLPDQRDKRLTGKQLADFHRERARIDELMRRPPVRVAQSDGR